MPRNRRQLSSTRTYHIVIKVADRQLIFEEPNDFHKYLSYLEYYKELCKFEIFAYCLMPNHVHILLRHSPDCSLETIFRKLNTAYAIWFNRKYNRTGFVQNGRYYSEPIENDQYLISVVRYIHFNPTKAGLEKSPGCSYQWSSFFDYSNNISQAASLTDTYFILNLLGSYNNFSILHSKTEELTETILDLNNICKRLPDNIANEIIVEVSNCHTVTEFQNLSIIKRNLFILLIHQKGVSIRQINRLTGTPCGVINRIIKQSKTSS
ncbi:MAG: transposase [Lachnospiraceae bacterium]|nr:transposase [Lachnospiraceae bacterium]